MENNSIKASTQERLGINYPTRSIHSNAMPHSYSNTELMTAAVVTQYGTPEVIQIRSLKKPVPRDNEVLVKINAASVTAADMMMRTGSPAFGRLFTGLRKPKNQIPGTGFAGIIETIGQEVSRFQKGDKVFGEIVLNDGTHADYVCIPEDGLLLKKPENLSYEEAAAVCDGALTALSFLKDVAKIKPGQRVLINGASGSLGTAAIQLAKYFGANVTGVCSSANMELVASLGADKVIDYTNEDFTQAEGVYDIIFDTVGKSSFCRCKNALTQNGIYLSPVFGLTTLLQMLWTSVAGQKKAKFSATGIRPVPELRILFIQLKQLLQTGKLKSVIDKRYPLEDIIEANRYVETGHKKGNVVLVME